MAEPYACPSCGGSRELLDWTVPDKKHGYQWTIKFTADSMPLCTRCANPEHHAHGLPLDPTRGLRPGATRQQDISDRWRDAPNTTRR